MAKIKPISLPKISLSAFGQVVFVFRETVKIIWATDRKLLFIITILGAVWGLSTLPNLYLGKAIIDAAIAGLAATNKTEAIKLLAGLIILRAVIDFGRQVTSRLQRRHMSFLQHFVDTKLQLIIGQKIQSLDIATVEDSAFKDRFEKIDKQGGNRVWNLVRILSEFPQNILGIFSALFPIFFFNNLLVTAIILLAIPGFFVGRKIVKLNYKLEEDLALKFRILGWSSYFLIRPQNYLEPRLLGNAPFILKRLESLRAEIELLRQKLRFFEVKANTLAGLPADLFDIGLNIWFFGQAILGKLSLGTAQMLFNAVNGFKNYLGSLLNSITDIYENYLYMVDLVWLLNLKSQSPVGHRLPAKNFTRGIEFKNVWFKYPKSTTWILKGINFTIGPKENLAIVGENGAGKTTLIKLLGRFYQPTKGEILVDGNNIFDYKERNYWDKISAVFQNFETYPFSARESIGFGDVKRIGNTAQIMAAAKQTGIHEFLFGLDKKYDNPLTKDFDGGVNPSGGQWQRIALARALFRKQAEIIILDEPTSSLDPKGEEEIFDTVISLAKDKNLILISHRFSTVRRASKIIVLDAGKIIEEGNHESLMKRNNHYAKLYNLQAKWYK